MTSLAAARAAECTSKLTHWRQARWSRARLIKRIFQIDIERSLGCTGEMQLIVVMLDSGPGHKPGPGIKQPIISIAPYVTHLMANCCRVAGREPPSFTRPMGLRVSFVPARRAKLMNIADTLKEA